MALKKVGPNVLRTVTWVGALVIEAWFLVTLCGASEYLPGRQNDIKVFEDTRFGNTCTMEVDRKLGNWCHYTTFGGFGPLWIWTSPESDCIYVWSDVVDSCQRSPTSARVKDSRGELTSTHATGGSLSLLVARKQYSLRPGNSSAPCGLTSRRVVLMRA